MNDEQNEQKRREIAAFRYALVAELANPHLSAAQVSELIRQKAEQEHQIPYLGPRRLGEACIRKWMYAFRKHGKPGLEPKQRSDAGRCRALSESETALLISTLEAKPHLTAASVLAQLRREGRVTGAISPSSLSRLVCSMGLRREQRMRAAEAEQHLKFEFFAPLECVQADCMHSIKVPDEKGVRRRAVLLTFIDDATRRILYIHFAFSERSLHFEAGIRHILAAHGRIGRLYVDNGAPFVGMQTKRITDSLGLLLIHSRPYTPRGRGKQERFFRTARSQFFRLLEPESIGSLADLSTRFRAWVEAEYHRAPHRGLGGATPLDRWLERASGIIPLDPTINLDSAFLHQVSRKVYRDSTFTLDGVLYEVPSSLMGERITLHYDPSLPPQRRRPKVYLDQKECGTAHIVDSYANTKVRRVSLHRNLAAELPPESESGNSETAPSAVERSLFAAQVPRVDSDVREENDA